MSVLEIKHQIERLSPDEQSQLESFLRAKRVAESTDFSARVSAAHRRVDTGDTVTAAQLRALLNAPPAASS